MGNLYKQYKKEIIPELKKQFGMRNNMETPRLEKIVLNVGLGHGANDKDFVKTVENNLAKITGQKAVLTKAKKSISNFKIRKGMIIGVKVTLRNEKMYNFLEKLINITFPRIRDFRGISSESIDKSGNITTGIKELTYFPEIQLDDLTKSHGLEITIATSAQNKEQCMELLKKMGFPFYKTLNSKL